MEDDNKTDISKQKGDENVKSEKDSSVDTTPSGGRSGLRNIGNTCYMDTGLQCLSHIADLTKLFISKDFMKMLNKDNVMGSGGLVAETFAQLLEQLWTKPTHVVNPLFFKRAFQGFDKQFIGDYQHDSQEFFAKLVDVLHEDLNEIKKKPYIETPLYKSYDKSQGDEMWNIFLKRNLSPIVDLLYGMTCNEIHCSECQEMRMRYEPNNVMMLPMPSEQYKITINILQDRNIEEEYDEEEEDKRREKGEALSEGKKKFPFRVCRIHYFEVDYNFYGLCRELYEKAAAELECDVNDIDLFIVVKDEGYEAHYIDISSPQSILSQYTDTVSHLICTIKPSQTAKPLVFRQNYLLHYSDQSEPCAVMGSYGIKIMYYEPDETVEDFMKHIESLLMPKFKRHMKHFSEKVMMMFKAFLDQCHNPNRYLPTLDRVREWSDDDDGDSDDMEIEENKEEVKQETKITNFFKSEDKKEQDDDDEGDDEKKDYFEGIDDLDDEDDEDFEDDNEEDIDFDEEEDDVKDIPAEDDAKEDKEVKEVKETKETKEAKETKETKEAKEAKEAKETKETKETQGCNGKHEKQLHIDMKTGGLTLNDDDDDEDFKDNEEENEADVDNGYEHDANGECCCCQDDHNSSKRDECCKDDHVTAKRFCPNLVLKHSDEEYLAWQHFSCPFPILLEPYASATKYDLIPSYFLNSLILESQLHEPMKFILHSTDGSLPSLCLIIDGESCKYQQDYFMSNEEKEKLKKEQADLEEDDKALTEINEAYMIKSVSLHNCKTTSWKTRHHVNTTVTLEDCFDLFVKKGNQDPKSLWYCPHCQKDVLADSVSCIWKAPRYLIIQLSRFEYVTPDQLGGFNIDFENRKRKVHTKVTFPLYDFDISSYVHKDAKKEGEEFKYDLIAVCNHLGTVDCGHYVAFCRDDNEDKPAWFTYDDDLVTPMKEKEVVTANAYMLVYRRQNVGNCSSKDVMKLIQDMMKKEE